MDAEKETNSSGVRALTICQPWAWAIIEGHKPYENRDWKTDYTGPLVIHAGKSLGWMREGTAFLRAQGLEVPADFELGKILGVVDMVGWVRPAETKGADGKPNPYAFGPYCHEYRNPRKLAVPIPYVGRQSMFSVARLLVAELLDGPDAAPPANETRDERIERAIETVGPKRLRRARQTDMGW